MILASGAGWGEMNRDDFSSKFDCYKMLIYNIFFAVKCAQAFYRHSPIVRARGLYTGGTFELLLIFLAIFGF